MEFKKPSLVSGFEFFLTRRAGFLPEAGVDLRLGGSMISKKKTKNQPKISSTKIQIMTNFLIVLSLLCHLCHKQPFYFSQTSQTQNVNKLYFKRISSEKLTPTLQFFYQFLTIFRYQNFSFHFLAFSIKFFCYFFKEDESRRRKKNKKETFMYET